MARNWGFRARRGIWQNRVTPTFSGETASVPVEVVQQFAPFHLGAVPARTESGASSTRSASGLCAPPTVRGAASPPRSVPERGLREHWQPSGVRPAGRSPASCTGKIERLRDDHFAGRAREVERNVVPEHRYIIIRGLPLSGADRSHKRACARRPAGAWATPAEPHRRGTLLVAGGRILTFATFSPIIFINPFHLSPPHPTAPLTPPATMKPELPSGPAGNQPKPVRSFLWKTANPFSLQ